MRGYGFSRQMPKEAKESKREGPECMRPCFPFKPGMLVGQSPSTLNDQLISAADSLRVERAVLPPRTFLIASQMLIKLFRTRFRVASKQTLLQSDVQRFENKLQSPSEISAAAAAEWAPPLPLLLKENEKFQKFLSLAGKAAIYPVLLIGTQLFRPQRNLATIPWAPNFPFHHLRHMQGSRQGCPRWVTSPSVGEMWIRIGGSPCALVEAQCAGCRREGPKHGGCFQEQMWT